MKKLLLILFFWALAAITLFFTACIPGGWGVPGYGSNPSGMGGGGMMGQGGMGGGGMMSGSGGGMMGQGGMGGGMMGGSGGMMGGQSGQAAPYNPPYGAPDRAISIDQALALAQKYAASLGNPDIVLAEVEEYANNFYALYKEKSTGIYAFEMLIDKFSSRVYPEQGPNMMWNIKYGPMSSMMGYTTTPITPSTINLQQAESKTRTFLESNLPGLTPGETHTFYGYYTIMIDKDSKIYGMLSVNGYSGQVWYHTWHGDFIQEKEVNS